MSPKSKKKPGNKTNDNVSPELGQVAVDLDAGEVLEVEHDDEIVDVDAGEVLKVEHDDEILRNEDFVKYVLNFWASWEMVQMMRPYLHRFFIHFLNTGTVDRESFEQTINTIKSHAGNVRETRDKIELFISQFK